MTPLVLLVLIALVLSGTRTSAFVILPSKGVSSHRLSLGIPKFILPGSSSESSDSASTKPGKGSSTKGGNTETEKPKMGMKGLIQLITAGAGSPFLGDYKGVDKETGNFMFELEANNLTDENGESKQTKAKYFEEGWVDEDAEPFKWPWQKKL